MEDAIVEHEVGIVVFIIDDDTFLARLKAEPFAKFKNEFLYVVNQGIFQIMLIHNFLRFQPEKLECERIVNLQLVAVMPLYGGQG